MGGGGERVNCDCGEEVLPGFESCRYCTYPPKIVHAYRLKYGQMLWETLVDESVRIFAERRDSITQAFYSDIDFVVLHYKNGKEKTVPVLPPNPARLGLWRVK